MEKHHASGSHAEIGFSIGRRFAQDIRNAVADNETLQQTFLPFHRSPEGQDLYDRLLTLHQKEYPDFMAEIDGIARGAEISFEQLFILNMRGEYRGYADKPIDRGCSTLSLIDDDHALFGHNEDGSLFYKDKMYVVEARVAGKTSFTAFSYPGFLCGNAFGFNREGICFCNNDVVPDALEIGLGRHFLARSLFEAATIEEAINSVTPAGRASGFNYTIGSVKERRIVNIEVSPHQHHVADIRGTHYRANHYLDLNSIQQTVDASSRTRVQRAASLIEAQKPEGVSGLLRILGDRKDPDYPIFRTGRPPDGLATMAICIFDLDARRLSIYTGHPGEDEKRRLEFPIMQDEPA